MRYFLKIGPDATCCVNARPLLSAGNLLFYEAPLYVYAAPCFYLHKVVATLSITDGLDTSCFFCFRRFLLIFWPCLLSLVWDLLHTTCSWQFAGTCLLTGRYDLGTSNWLVVSCTYDNSKYRLSSDRWRSWLYLKNCPKN